MCDLPDRTKWLSSLADEMERMEHLMPFNVFPSDDERPAWAENIEREVSVVLLPAAKLRKEYLNAAPRRVGAVLGHACAMAVWMNEALAELMWEASEAHDIQVTEEHERKGEEFLNTIAKWYEAARNLAKHALTSCVDQTYEDMSGFLTGFSDGFARKPKKFGFADIGGTSFKVYFVMLMSWRQIEGMKSVPELYRMLVAKLGAPQVGDLKRIEKICQRLGLSFRKPGRPSKT
jgi:hypothetical protein